MSTPRLKKIAFHLNTLAQGGAERVVSNLADRFAKEGYEVLIATEWFGEDEFETDPRVKRVHVGLSAAQEKKGRIGRFFARLKNLKRFVEEEQPDVLVAFAKAANYRALMAAGKGSVPVVISIRTTPVGHYDSLSDSVMIRLLFPKAAGCVYQTHDQRAFFKPYLQDGTRIILNPVNPKYFGVTHPAEKERCIVQHARLVDFKNHPLLIDAFMEVRKTHPDYVLRIYGPDSFDGTKELLESKIRALQAESFIFLMGGSDTLEQELPKAEIYAFSSDWEGLPNTLLEAMALGMPVVATDCPCGGPKTVIEDGVNGLLVPIKDRDAMAQAIRRLIENPDEARRLGENARRIGERTSVDKIFEQWRDYLEEIVCSHSPTTGKSSV